MLEQILRDIKDKVCPRKLVETHKMTEAHKKLWKEAEKKIESAISMKREAETLKKKFWNKVEGDLNEFDRQLKVNAEDMTIEVYEDDCDDCKEGK